MNSISKKKDIDEFYKSFDLSKVKNKNNLKNELLYQLYKKPIKDNKQNTPTYAPNEENRFNRLLPALGYISHDFKSASSSRKSEEAWIASKPNRILQGIEPY